MEKRCILILILAFLYPFELLAQDKLYVRHRAKPTRGKVLYTGERYYLRTIDSTYKWQELAGYTDQSLLIPIHTQTDRDTLYIYQTVRNGRHAISYTHSPVYRRDTLSILFEDIDLIKVSWFPDRRWVEPFAWTAALSVVGTLMIPVVALTEGKSEVRNLKRAVFWGFTVGGTVTFLGTRNHRYDLKRKWELRVGL